jgi:hypothetical protein
LARMNGYELREPAAAVQSVDEVHQLWCSWLERDLCQVRAQQELRPTH